MNKTVRLGVVMDPIGSIKPWKDSTLAMLLEAQRRNWLIYYFEPDKLYFDDGIAFGNYRQLSVADDNQRWYGFAEDGRIALQELDVILMRRDPPFDLEYIYTTYLLEQAEEQGTLIVNNPASLRDCNEKLYTREFPQCCPPTRVSRDAALIREFVDEHQDTVIKPLDSMGGSSIFRLNASDPNRNAIIDAVTRGGSSQTMVQKYIPEITEGDKRILLIDGEPIPYALARIPSADDFRGNIAAGATTRSQPLSDRDLWLCQQIGPSLRKRGLIFTGIDVIGNYLTEINITSPTCIRELDADFDLNISAILFDSIESRLHA